MTLCLEFYLFMKEVIKKKDETRKDYLLRVALAYLETIDDSEFADALGLIVKFDDAECDGSCLIDDIKMELEI